MHIYVSHENFHAQAQMPVRVRLLAEDQRKMMQGKFGLLKRSMYVARHAASNWECDGQEHIKRWNYEVGQRSKILFHLRNNKISAMTHDDFVVTGPVFNLIGLKNKRSGVYPIQTKIISRGSTESIKACEQKDALEREREEWCTSMIPAMWTCMSGKSCLRMRTRCRIQQQTTQ